MESLREVKRKMEREIEKGRATPIRLEKMEVNEDSYKEIVNEAQLNNVLNWLLRLNEYRTGEATVANNVYMDIKPTMRQAAFVRGKSVIDRMCFHMDISHHIKRIQPDFQGNCYVEEAKCMFSLTDEEKEKCKYTYKDRETYGFILSNAYILGLFCICEDARRDFAFFHTEQDVNDIIEM